VWVEILAVKTKNRRVINSIYFIICFYYFTFLCFWSCFLLETFFLFPYYNCSLQERQRVLSHRLFFRFSSRDLLSIQIQTLSIPLQPFRSRFGSSQQNPFISQRSLLSGTWSVTPLNFFTPDVRSCSLTPLYYVFVGSKLGCSRLLRRGWKWIKVECLW